MTATQAPTPGPLSGSVGCAETPLQDLLRRVPKDAVLRWEIPEEGRALWQLGSASSPVGSLMHRAADQLDAFRLAPTAPVEASGSEREHGPKCWGKTSISDEMMYCYCGSTDSPPPTERRDAMTWYHGARGEKTMADFVAEIPHRVQMEANSGCWLWEGQNCRGGYGSAKIDGRKTLAHRLSYIAHNGPLRDDEHVLHSCDTPACINPDHLRPGSRGENQQEARERGRFSGEVRPYRRLNETENEAIVAYAKTVSVRAAARKFGIDPATVRRKIKNAK